MSFRAAVEAGDHAAVVATLSEDVVLESPVSFTPFRGREQVAALLAVVMEVFEDFRYTDELHGPGGAVHGLVFRTRIGDREAEGIDIVRHDDRGRVEHLTVMVRPASALMALGAAVGPHAERIKAL